MNVSYREAEIKDLLKLQILFKTVYICIYGRKGVSDEFANFITARFSQKQIKHYLKSDKSKIYVACLGENLVGALQIDLNKQAPIEELHSAEINKLYILPDYQGKGIAQQLMIKGESYLRSIKEKTVWIISWDQNPRALKFYQKIGYEIIGTAPFPMEMNTYTNYVLSKKL